MHLDDPAVLIVTGKLPMIAFESKYSDSGSTERKGGYYICQHVTFRKLVIRKDYFNSMEKLVTSFVKNIQRKLGESAKMYFYTVCLVGIYL